MPLWIRFDGLEAGGQRGSDVYINRAAPLTTDMRFDRTDRFGRDGQLAGADYISKRVWDLTLHTNQHTEADALAFAQAWESAWHDKDIRNGTKTVPLEYSSDRQTWHRVYGRPTLFTGPERDVFTVQGRGVLEIQFEQLDPLHYSAPETVSLTAVASAFEGGWLAPFVFPLVATGTSVPSAVSVINQGNQPAPIMVTFYGPSNQPRAWAGATEVKYNGALAHDEHVTISGLDHTVMLHGGGRTEPVAVPGRLSPHTLLSDLTVSVGTTEWWYQAIDETAQSKADFTWWSAYQSMQ